MAHFPQVDFLSFHRETLPSLLLGGHNELVLTDPFTMPALALRHTDAGAFTYRPSSVGMEIIEGEEKADIVVEIDDACWQDFYHEMLTCVSILISNRGKLIKGSGDDFVQWEPSIRAMYHGRSIFNPALVDLRDLDGGPLDLSQKFTMDSDPKQMANFLDQAGFLHVRDVYSSDEIDTFRKEVYRCRSEAVQGDGKTWWAEDAQGNSHLSRITYIDQRSQTIAGSFPDPRIDKLVALGKPENIPLIDRMEGVTCLYKNYGMETGLSDLPWHVDTGVGGYKILSPTLLANLYLENGTPESGEVRILPGSWKGSTHFYSPKSRNAPQGVSVRAGAGDVTLHYDNVLHASMAPQAEGKCRVSLYIAYYPPVTLEHIPPGKAFNDIFADSENGITQTYDNNAKK